MPQKARHLTLRLADFLPRSRANGPGVRAVVWVQGCGRRCPGCANPQMQDPAAGREVTVQEVWGWVQEAAPDGLTFTGGEPFDQPSPLAELGRLAHEHGLTLVCFTGYTLEEVRGEADPARLALLDQTDLLIDGPYDQDQPCSEPLRSSANQRLHFLTGAITPEHVAGVPRVEVVIVDGEVKVTGLAPEVSARLRTRLQEEDGDA